MITDQHLRDLAEATNLDSESQVRYLADCYCHHGDPNEMIPKLSGQPLEWFEEQCQLHASRPMPRTNLHDEEPF